MPRWVSRLAGIAILAGLIWLIYRPVLDAPLIFDDASTLVGNPSIRQLWPLDSGGPLDPPAGTPVYGRPLANLSFALNYHFGELQPRGYRAVNLIIHLLSAVLLWAIVARTLRLDYFSGRYARSAELLGFAAALVWALHPLGTEAVVYVTQRTELLMGCCYLATLYGSLRYWQASGSPGRTLWLLLTALVCLAGMLSKEMMASAPAIVLLYERTFLAGSFRAALRRSWPLYLALALTWVPLVLLNLDGPRTPASGFGLGVPAHVWWLTQTKVLFLCLKLAAWPWPLVIHYEIPYLTTPAAAWPWVLAASLLAAATVVLVWRRSAVGYVFAFVFAVLSPTLVIPLVAETAAERRMYVPLAALMTLAVVGGFTFACWVTERIARSTQRREFKRLPIALFACAFMGVLAAFLLLDTRRLAAYRSDLTLWQDAAIHQPKNPLVRVNLGIALDGAGRREEAIAELREAVRLAPDSFRARYNLARAQEAAFQSDEAISNYRQALRIEPAHAPSHNNLGRLLAAQGHPKQAILEYEQSLAADPRLAEAHTNLGVLLAGYGYYGKAIHHLEESLRLKPNLAAHTNLAVVYARAGRMEDAQQLARKAIPLAREEGNDALVEQLEAALVAPVVPQTVP